MKHSILSWQQFIKIRQYRLLQSMMFESVWKGPRVYKIMLIYFILPMSLQARGGKPMRPPPRPQIKTCPPVSRIFSLRPDIGSARAITFLDSAKSNTLSERPFEDSNVYNSAKKESYFQQVRIQLCCIASNHRLLTLFSISKTTH